MTGRKYINLKQPFLMSEHKSLDIDLSFALKNIFRNVETVTHRNG